ALDRMGFSGWRICIHPDPWQHHGEGDNYQALETLKEEKIEQLIREKPFCKLSLQVPLEQWDTFVVQAASSYDRLMEDLSR
ncbi:MAG TPA: hypothetical protein VMV20_00310, partial [Chitinophagaceae bacterium]|nr:hypothetical protein [Chitinophagaceae bacterium]